MKFSFSRSAYIKTIIAFLMGIFFVFLGWDLYSRRPIDVTVKLSPQKFFVGDRLSYSAKVSAPRTYELDIPEKEELLPGFDVKDASLVSIIKAGRARFELTYNFIAYDLGKTEIPLRSIRYREPNSDKWKVIGIPPVSFETKRLTDIDISKAGKVRMSSSFSGAPDGAAKDDSHGAFIDAPIRLSIEDSLDIQKVRTLKDWIFLGLYWAAGIAVFIFIVIFVVSSVWYSREKRPPSTYEKAMNTLIMLEKNKLVEKGEHKDFCAKLYSIINGYCYARFGMPGASMTAGEFIKNFKEIGGVDPELKEFIIQKMLLCDTVKYSIGTEAASTLNDSLAKEREFIEKTSPPDEKGDIK